MPLTNSILKTKFFLPQPTSDFVERKSLISKFERLKTMPLMLVSASTGYGKSTVVSAFFVNQKEDYAWLSLSERENVFQQFILYFIKAIQTKVDKFGEEVLALVYAPAPPSQDELADLILNELAELGNHLYLAIDDYHLIKNTDIHHFLSRLFEYPHPYFRLILITRRDPELPFSVWRSKNKLVEIRSSDLKFSHSEISEFYKRSISYFPEENVLSKIEEATEGWVSGLRILLLSSNNSEELQQQLSNFNYKNSRVIHDLVNTVLSNQPELTTDKLLKLSILKEFNLDMFSELCLTEQERDSKEIRFNEFTTDLIRTNMFIIALDDRHNWFRFHHLFTEHLYELLLKKYKENEIDELRLKAADWFFRNNLPEEAIGFYLQANQVTEALNIFTEYRLQLISANRIENLEIILNLFPQELNEKNGMLLVTKGWLLLQKGNIPQMASCIEPLEQMLPHEGYTRELLDLLLGEVHTMKAFNLYSTSVETKEIFEHSKKAINLLKGQNPYALGFAWVYYGVALYQLGNPTLARKDLYNELETTTSDILKGQVLIILTFLDWFDCNLAAMQQSANHLLQLGNESGINFFIALGNNLLGIMHYCQNQDEKALGYLETAHELRHYSLTLVSVPTGMSLADIYAKDGKEAESKAIIQTYEKTAMDQGGKLFVNITKSASAELAWKYQNDLSGLRWAKENDYRDFLPLVNLYSPELVQARILTTDSNPESLLLAQDIIENTIPFFEERNDNNVLFRTFVIQALIYYKSEETKKAFEFLQKAIDISSIGKYIRPYLDLGDSMKNLLLEYKATKNESKHLNEILQEFTIQATKNDAIVLSEREKEILLLSEKLTNKEVGNQLFIAEKTVKSHITNINKKLNVNSKLEAISKAKKLVLI